MGALYATVGDGFSVFVGSNEGAYQCFTALPVGFGLHAAPALQESETLVRVAKRKREKETLKALD